MPLLTNIETLLQASTYRGFLLDLYKTNKALNKQFSYAYIAKRCGFSSKSFIKEVIDAKKSLSQNSCQKIIKGLRLPKLVGDYFFYLTARDELFTTLSKEQIHKELSRLKLKLLKKDTNSVISSDIFLTLNWPYVYAALGTLEGGASLIEIQQRLNLSEAILKETLFVLIEKGLVLQKSNRFYVKDSTLFLEEIGSSKHFKAFFLNAINLQYQKAKQSFNSEDELFFSMSFSTQSKKMKEFKKDLQNILDKYTSDIEDPNGDKVVTLTCGMHYL